jgi:hypothetical protein
MEHLTSESLFGFNFKLWRRFWSLLELRKDGKSYEKVLQLLLNQISNKTNFPICELSANSNIRLNII